MVHVMKKHDVFDVSEELFVQRWKNGVRLIRPEHINYSTLKSTNGVQTALPTVSNLFAMPFGAYFLNTQHTIRNVSETTAHRCGYDSEKDMIGTSAFDCFKKESAEFIIKHDKAVFSSQSIVFQDEYILRSDGQLMRGVAIKFPLFDVDEKIVGIFGCTIFQEFLSESFPCLLNTGLLANTSSLEMMSNDASVDGYLKDNCQEIQAIKNKLTEKTRQFISLRESECLFHLIRGKSARETGYALNLSQRTVEFYLNSLKDKLNCRKKSELIEITFKFLMG